MSGTSRRNVTESMVSDALDDLRAIFWENQPHLMGDPLRIWFFFDILFISLVWPTLYNISAPRPILGPQRLVVFWRIFATFLKMALFGILNANISPRLHRHTYFMIESCSMCPKLPRKGKKIMCTYGRG